MRTYLKETGALTWQLQYTAVALALEVVRVGCSEHLNSGTLLHVSSFCKPHADA
jgi:hypothetical protein